jgi:hypothetical protein
MLRLEARVFLTTLLILGGIAACDQTNKRATNLPTGTQAVGDLIGHTTTIAGQKYIHATDRSVAALPVPTLSKSTLIGADGGRLDLLGHHLEVPAGAVATPTQFTLTARPSGFVDVELTATIRDASGQLVDVGDQGFNQPVELTLTYARSDNVSAASKLVVLREGESGAASQVLPTVVDDAQKVVVTNLNHFSLYSVAYPD